MSPFLQNVILVILAIICERFGFSKFSGLFYYSKLGIYIQQVVRRIEFEFDLNRDIDLLYSPK